MRRNKMLKKPIAIMMSLIMVVSTLMPGLSGVATPSFATVPVYNPTYTKVATPVTGKVNTWDITLTAEADKKSTPCKTVIVFDRSGSMEGTKLTNAKKAANLFIDKVIDGNAANEIAIVSYATYVTSHEIDNAYFSKNKTKLKNVINGLSANGFTNTSGGLDAANTIFGSTTGNRNVVLLSDGAWNRGVDPTTSATTIKNEGITIYSIGLETSTDATNSLKAIASPGKYYSATASGLGDVFAGIAQSISSSIKDAVVTDVMGTGFEIPISESLKTEYSSGEIPISSVAADNRVPGLTISSGTGNYNWKTGKITWYAGDANVKVGERYKLELKYRVEVNDSLLSADKKSLAPGLADVNGLYKTNASATITYNTPENYPMNASFESPKVNPTLMQVKKTVEGYCAPETTFGIKVVGPSFEKTYTLANGESIITTELRNIGEYTISEPNTNGYTSSFANSRVLINNTTVNLGSGTTSGIKFTIAQPPVGTGITVDTAKSIAVDVKNTAPKTGKLTIKKQIGETTTYPAGITNQTVFTFTVTGPANYTSTFTLKGGESKDLTSLTCGEYTVSEAANPDFTTAYVSSASAILTPAANTATITVKNTAKKGDVEATKTWVNGDSANRPDVYFKLYRQIGTGTATEVSGAGLKKVSEGTASGNVVTVKWTNIDKYDQYGAPYTFTVKEVDSNGADFTPANYTKVESGLNVTNTFTSTNTSFTATKKWVDAPTGSKTVNFELWRTTNATADLTVENLSDQEKVTTDFSGTTVIVAALTSDTDTATKTWSNLLKHELTTGKEYRYFVKEVVKQGDKWVVGAPEGYTKSTTDGKTITNTYNTPGSIKVTKSMTDAGQYGPFKFKVTRIDTNPVQEIKTFTLAKGDSETISELAYGTYKVEEIDNAGVALLGYFNIKIGNTATSSTTVTLNTTNKSANVTINNEPKTKDLYAQKVWVDAPTGTEAISYLVLYKDGVQVAGSQREVKSSEGTKTKNWINLPIGDGVKEYTYTVKECIKDSNGNYVEGVPADYALTTATNVGDLAYVFTNTYQNMGKLTVKKVLVKETNDTSIYKKFKIKITNVNNQAITRTQDIAAGGEYTFEGLPYGTYKVEEIGGDGNVTENNIANNFTVTYDNNANTNGVVVNSDSKTNPVTVTVTNKSNLTSVVGTKVWSGGGNTTKPTDIYFELWKKGSTGTTDSKVRDAVALGSGTNVEFTRVPKADIDNYYIKEVTSTGADYTNDRWAKSYVTDVSGNTSGDKTLFIKNTYIPTTSIQEATKTWTGGKATDRPNVYFILYRTTLTLTNDVIASAQKVAIKEVPKGVDGESTVEVDFGQQDATDVNNVAWNYFVRETTGSDLYTATALANGAGIGSVGKAYKVKYDATPSMKVTNTFDLETKTLKVTKVFEGGANVSKIDVYAKLKYANGTQIDPAKIEIIWDAANGQQNATFTVQKYDIEGNELKYSFDETNASGGDLQYPAGKVFTMVGNGAVLNNDDVYVFTNKYEPETATINATKKWSGGSSKKADVWFKLQRKINDGEYADATMPTGVNAVQKAYTKIGDTIETPSWANMPVTDNDGYKYTYKVVECTDADGTVGTPEGFTFTSTETQLNDSTNTITGTNAYSSSTTTSFTATKKWDGGKKTTAYFQLYRTTFGNIFNGTAERVKTPVQIPSDNTYTWSELKKVDDATGYDYIYFVRETTSGAADATPIVSGGTIDVTNGYYTVTYNDTDHNVTNTYSSKDKTITATKSFVNGENDVNRPTDIWAMPYVGETAVSGAQAKKIWENKAALKPEWSVPITDRNGDTITYTFKEGILDGSTFTPFVKGTNNFNYNINVPYSGNDYTITNAYDIPNNTTVTAYKKWLNGSSVRPDNLYLVLSKADGTLVKSTAKKVLANDDTYTWSNLPSTNTSGTAITYTVKEYTRTGSAPDYIYTEYTGGNGWKAPVIGAVAGANNSYNVTNEYDNTSVQGKVTATKVWDGGSEVRPDVIFKLYRTTGSAAELVSTSDNIDKDSNNVTVDFYQQNVNDPQGKPYTYYVEEWVAGGNAKVDTINVINGKFTVSYTDASGKKIEADKTTNVTTVTNKYATDNTKEVKALKIWNGGPDKKPTIEFELYRNGTATGNKTTVDAISNEATWTGLAVADENGKPYTYTAKEVGVVSGHIAVADGESGRYEVSEVDFSATTLGSYITTITNSYKSPTTDLTAKKAWDGGSTLKQSLWAVPYVTDVNGATSIATYENGNSLEAKQIYKVEGEIDEAMTAKWEKVRTHDADGKPYTFTFKEYINANADDSDLFKTYESIEQIGEKSGFIATREGKDFDYTIKNTFHTEKTTISAIKVWVNGEDLDRDDVYITLLRDGTTAPAMDIEGGVNTKLSYNKATATTNGDVNLGTKVEWTVPKKDPATGKDYNYTVLETDKDGNQIILTAPNGTIKSESNKDNANNFTITNTYTSYDKGAIEATKVWDGGEYRTNERTNLVKFKLYRTTATGITSFANMPENAEALDGFIQTVPAGVNGSTDPITVTMADAESGLKKTDDRGNVYTYFVRELDSSDKLLANGDEVTEITNKQKGYYTVNYTGDLEVKNVFTPPKFTVTANKTWNGGPTGNNRPDVYFGLFQGSTLVDGKGKLVPVSNTVSWTVDLTDKSGKPLSYTLKEGLSEAGDFTTESIPCIDKADPTIVYGKYNISIGEEKAPDGAPESLAFTLTNNFETVKTKVEGEKIWATPDELSGETAPSVKFALYQDGAKYKDTITINGVDTTATWTDLPKYYNDVDGTFKEHEYTVKEENVPKGYLMTQEGNTITNTYNKITTMEAIKYWDGGADTDKNVDIYFKLYANGIEAVHIDGTAVEAIKVWGLDGNTGNVWNNLPYADASGKINYTVKEFKDEAATEEYQYDDSFPFKPQESVYENSVGSNTKTISLTNTYVPPKNTTTIEAIKVWDGGSARADVRPEISFQLYRTIEAIDMSKSNANMNAEAVGEPVVITDTGMVEEGKTTINQVMAEIGTIDAKDRNGIPYKFFVREVVNGVEIDHEKSFNDDGTAPLQGSYKVTYGKTTDEAIDFLKVTNTYSPSKVAIESKKIWVGGDAKNRPVIYIDLIKYLLGEDGVRTDEASVGDKLELKLDEDGNPIVDESSPYTVEKLDVEHIDSATGEKTVVTTYKLTWKDVDATDSNGQEYIFEIKEYVEKGDEGVVEGAPKDYEGSTTEQGISTTDSSINTTNEAINTYHSQLISITFTKKWDGDGGNTEVRPTVYFKLQRTNADGTTTDVEGVKTLDGSQDNQTITWNALPKTDSNAFVYTYTVIETDAGGNPFERNDYKAEGDGQVVAKEGTGMTDDEKNQYIAELLNKYQVFDFTVVKEWIDGSKANRNVTFNLYQTTKQSITVEDKNEIAKGEAFRTVTFANGLTPATADAPNSVDVAKNSYTWGNLPVADKDNNIYTYFVVEKFDGSFTSKQGELTYTTAEGINAKAEVVITNTYKIPTADILATKKWVGGSNRPEVYFKLMRTTDAAIAATQVPGTTVQAVNVKVDDNTFTTTFAGIDLTDIDGTPYILSVQEVTIDGVPTTIPGYNKSEVSLVVTNSVQGGGGGDDPGKKDEFDDPGIKPNVVLPQEPEGEGDVINPDPFQATEETKKFNLVLPQTGGFLNANVMYALGTGAIALGAAITLAGTRRKDDDK